MDGVGRPTRWRTLAGLAAVCAAVVVIVVVVLLSRGGDERAAAPSASEPDRPVAATPARLAEPVTVTSSAPGEALALVETAHTIVFAGDDPDTAARAAMLALELRAPLVLVPPRAAAAGEPSVAPSQGAGADPRAAAARAARQRGVVRAVTVGDGATDVARSSGARQVLAVPEAGAPAATARDVIAAAGDGAQARGLGAPLPAEGAVERGTSPAAPSAAPTDDGRTRARVAPLPAPPPTGAAMLVRPRAAEAVAAVVTARSVGHEVVATRASDLRAAPKVGARLAQLADGEDPPPLLLAGDALADLDPDALTMQAAVAMTGVELPGGGQLVFDPQRPAARRYVGLYGVPHSPALGALGEQAVPDSVTRAKRLARSYQRVVGDDVDIVPCFEIIATVASAGAGKDRNYSNELAVADLRPAVDAAAEAGIYVLLDLQPGRTDFLTQARRYRELLREPHVGLALDPEWRLRRDQRHLEQIGSVDVDEVNEVTAWLSRMVERDRLPQKMLLLHQFRTSMVRGRERMDTTRPGLAFVIQMDGQGPQGTKLDTWRVITADPPPAVQFGWKNFYDEDTPTRSPADTMALEPAPVFVSYQ